MGKIPHKSTIYRAGLDGDTGYTLHTAMYDLVGRRLVVYAGNPRSGHVIKTIPLV